MSKKKWIVLVVVLVIIGGAVAAGLVLRQGGPTGIDVECGPVERMKIVVEPSGATTLAALRKIAPELRGKRVGMIVTGGTTADCTQAMALIDGLTADALMADKAYDTNELLEWCEDRGSEPVIPPKANRKDKRHYDKALYKLRHLVDDRGRNQRLVALYIDHDMIIGQPQGLSHFLQAIRTGRMRSGGHTVFSAKTVRCAGDALIVGGNHHPAGAAQAGLLPDALHHRLAVNIEQRLAGQTGRAIA